MTSYRARWIDAQGNERRDDYFEAHPERHESARYVTPVALITLTIDSSYFKQRPEGWRSPQYASPLHEHLEGFMELVSVDEQSYIIVNDEGAIRDGWKPNPNPDVRAAASKRGDVIFGPVVLVEEAPF